MIKKIKNLIDFKEIEVKFTICLTFIFLILFLKLDIYTNFNSYKELINSLLELLIGSYIGLIGLMLTGLSIILNMLSSKINNEIKTLLKGIDFIEEISFDFIIGCIIIIIHITYILLTLFSIKSEMIILDINLFYFLVILHIYLFFFIISYSVALIYNCYRTFLVANKIEENINLNLEYSTFINEIKIDLMLKRLVDNGILNKNDFIKDIEKLINNSDIKNDKKHNLINYLKDYYDKNKS